MKSINGVGIIGRFLTYIWNQVTELLYPSFCVLCDSVLVHGSNEVLCEDCQTQYPILEGDLCEICSKPLADAGKSRCKDCRERVHFFENGKALWVYEGAVKEAVKAYKYRNRQEMGVLFAKAMARYYNENELWQVDYVVPVPLHREKKRMRGFDQTALMADIFSEHTGIPILEDVLTRQVVTLPQEGLSDKERMANVHKAFACSELPKVGLRLLLLDDVYTTGATLDGCARVMADCGAGEIYFMTIAVGRGY